MMRPSAHDQTFKNGERLAAVAIAQIAMCFLSATKAYVSMRCRLLASVCAMAGAIVMRRRPSGVDQTSVQGERLKSTPSSSSPTLWGMLAPRPIEIERATLLSYGT
jgi:hypothetical protein